MPVNGPAHPPLPTTSPASCLLTDDLSLQLTTYLLLTQKWMKSKNFLVSLPFIDAFPYQRIFQKIAALPMAACRWGSLPLYAPIFSKAFLTFHPAVTILSTFCFTHRNCRVSTFSFLHQQCVGMEMVRCWSRRALGNKCAENIYFVSHAASLHHRRREIIIYTKQTIARGKSFFPFR